MTRKRAYLADLLARQNDPAAASILGALQAAEAGDNGALLRALDLLRCAGERTPATLDAYDRQNRVLEGIAAEYFPNDGPSAAASKIFDALREYRARGAISRAGARPPTSGIEALLHEFLVIRDGVIGARAIANRLKKR